MGSAALAGGTLLAAGEAHHNDGRFDVPDDYRRLNGLVRYHNGTERAIGEGLISRWGSLNPTDGGITSRASLSFSRVKTTDTDQAQFSAYIIRYELDLYSTFAYFLKDPVFGDQMLQHDDRVVYGLKGSKTWVTEFAGVPMTNVIGAQARVDNIRDVAIDPTFQRKAIGTRQTAAVEESSGAIYAESSLQWRPDVRTVIGLREDEFDFKVTDKMVNPNGSCNITSDPLGCDTGNRRASILNPKLGVILGPWAQTTYFINIADGYHSNDARGITRSGENQAHSNVTPLTRATSAELGLSSTAIPNLQTSLDVFELKLKSELVFDGDAGVTAPRGATTRQGIEWGNAYHVNSWLSVALNAHSPRRVFIATRRRTT